MNASRSVLLLWSLIFAICRAPGALAQDGSTPEPWDWSRTDRPVYTGAPTPEQALGAIQTYGSYFGPFSVHEDGGYLVHHRVGNLNPGQAGTDAQRFFELTDTTLTLKPPPRMVDGREVQGVITWERISN